MKKQMIHNFAYDPNTFLANAQEYGLKAALKEDWYITRKNIGNAIGTLTGTLENSVIALLSIPIIVYAVPKMIIDVNRHILSRIKASKLEAL